VVTVRRLSLLLSAVVAILFVAPATAQAAAPFPTSSVTVMASAGDSITRGFDATLFPCLLADCPQYSWATGTSTSVSSHWLRIRGTRSASAVQATNVAKTGAKMLALGGQLGAVPTTAQYVTVLMGANDVCTANEGAMTPTDTFRQQFSDALAAFYKTHPSAYVFVASIPNVYQLWATLHTNRSAASAWRTFDICQSMLSTANDEPTRQRVLQREVDFNSALASVCGSVAGGRCLFDNNAVFNYAFQPREVSTVDYFHPSITGQATLAALTWKASYWGS